jgi:uncharacterized protein YukE
VEVIQQAEDVEAVQRLAVEAETNISALASATCLRISEKMRQGVQQLFQELGSNAMITMEGKHEMRLPEMSPNELWMNTSELTRIGHRELGDGVFDYLRTKVYGGMAGSAIAMVVGGTIGSVIPVIGTIVGSWAGVTIAGIWGMTAATTFKGKKELEQLKRETSAALMQAFASAHQSASDRISDLVQDLQSEAARMVQEMVAKANESLAGKRDDLMQRRKQTQAELAASRLELEGLVKAENSISASLQALHQALNSTS